MLLEDHHLDAVRWSTAVRDVAVGVGGGCRIESITRDDTLTTVQIVADGPGQVVLEAPLGNASGVWHAGFDPLRGLPADWAGREPFSAVWSLPLLVLCDVDEQSHVAVALDCMTASGVLEYGVSEESKSFVVRFEVDAQLAASAESVRLLLPTSVLPFGDAIRTLSDELRRGLPTRARSELALEPVFSTWYAYSQRISAETIATQGALARRLGCRSVFIDDGWQEQGDGRWYRGCGDWVPDGAKFPDLAKTVRELHDEGLGAVLWIAPLLLGAESRAFAELSSLAPHHSESLRAQILDPRHPEVRRRITATCARLMSDYELDGLKVDFLNNAMVYAGTPSTGDIADVGEAMTLLLADISAAVEAVRPGSLIEYRQPYVSPEIAGFADVVRANDCPADADQNRRSTIDLRMLASEQVVHSDPMMWDHRAGADAVARQLLAGFFAVPQISMPLDVLSAEHVAVVTRLLDIWRDLRDVLIGGRVTASLPGEGYPIVTSRLGSTLVVAAYQPRCLELDLEGVERLVIVNATARDALPYRLSSGVTTLSSDQGDATDLASEGFLRVAPWDVRVHHVG